METLPYVKETSPKRIRTTWFHLQEMFGINKPTETEDTLVVAKVRKVGRGSQEVQGVLLG